MRKGLLIGVFIFISIMIFDLHLITEGSCVSNELKGITNESEHLAANQIEGDDPISVSEKSLEIIDGEENSNNDETVLEEDNIDTEWKTNDTSEDGGLIGNVWTVLISIVCSVFAALLFELSAFKIPTSKIIFSPKIEKRFRNGGFRYRIRLINVGRIDVFDVRYAARLKYRYLKENGELSRKNVVYLDFGQRSYSPLLFGKCEQNKRKFEVFCRTSELRENEDFYRAFDAEQSSPEIREKAKNKTLLLDDVIREYGEYFEIQVFAFGIDSLTGVEKLFRSKIYTPEDAVIYGNFVPPTKTFDEYEDYINYIFTIDEHKNTDGNKVSVNCDTEKSKNLVSEIILQEMRELETLEELIKTKKELLNNFRSEKEKILLDQLLDDNNGDFASEKENREDSKRTEENSKIRHYVDGEESEEE